MRKYCPASESIELTVFHWFSDMIKEKTAQESRIENNLKDFYLGWVCRADVETLQVRFKHPLWNIKTGRVKTSANLQLHQLLISSSTHKQPILYITRCSSPSSWSSSLPRSEEQHTGLHWRKRQTGVIDGERRETAAIPFPLLS